MNNALSKTKVTRYAAATPGVPADPGQPYFPARWVSVVEQVIYSPTQSTVYKYSEFSSAPGSGSGLNISGRMVPQGASVVTNGLTGMPQGYMYPVKTIPSAPSTKYVTRTYWAAMQPYIPPTAEIPAKPSQTTVDLRLGWNSTASAKTDIRRDGRFDFKVAYGVSGVLVGLKEIGSAGGYMGTDFGILFMNGIAQIVEKGVINTTGFSFGTYDPTQVFSIERMNGQINFGHDGWYYQVSANYTDAPLSVEVTMFTAGDSIFDPSIYEYSGSRAAMEPMTSVSSKGAYRTAMVSMRPMTGASRSAVRCAGAFDPMVGASSDYDYAASFGRFPMFVSASQGGLPIPTYSNTDVTMVYMVGGATGMTGEVGQSTGVMAGFLGQSSDHAYCDSRTIMEAATGYSTAYEGNNNAYVYSFLFGLDRWSSPAMRVVAMNSDFSVATVLTVNHVMGSTLPCAINVTDLFELEATLGVIMNSFVQAGFAVPVFDGPSSIWVVNEAGQSTRYESFPFNSYGKIDGHYFGARNDGIYMLEGASDNGQPVVASIGLGQQAFGTSELKRVNNCYLGTSSSGRMYLKVHANGEEFVYAARTDSDVLRTQRVDVGKGIRATYMSFDVCNSDGCDFELASVEFTTVALGRRI